MQAEPWCHCQGCILHVGPCRSRTRLERDHIIPKSKGGSEGRENEHLLCHDCHWEKTKEESPRIHG